MWRHRTRGSRIPGDHAGDVAAATRDEGLDHEHLPAVRGNADPLAPPRVCLLGPPIEHRDALLAMLAGANATWMADSHSYSQLHARPHRSRLGRGVDVLLGTRDPIYVDHALAQIDATQSEVVIGYWGTLPLGDLTALKRHRPSLRVVALLLCYPLATEPLGLLRQKLALRQAAAYLDGVICPTPEMAGYLEETVFSGNAPRIGVIPPCWPLAYQATARTVADPAQPNLIFVGRTDLSGATVHSADDIRPLMRAVLDAGIELHHGFSTETADGHPRRRTFQPVGIQQLIGMMAGFDASLIAYNLAACKCTERFALTVPDRLLSSVAAGIPIAIPRAGYEASKTYLRDYAAVIEFDTPRELMARLSDRDQMHELQEIAWRSRRHYAAEAQGRPLADFLGRLAC